VDSPATMPASEESIVAARRTSKVRAKGLGGIRRTGPKRVLKSVEKMLLHLTAYQTKTLEATIADAVVPLLETLADFGRRMEQLEARVAWATRPGRRGPGRPPKKRGPGRPPKKRGPGRPRKKRGPGRPRGS